MKFETTEKAIRIMSGIKRVTCMVAASLMLAPTIASASKSDKKVGTSKANEAISNVDSNATMSEEEFNELAIREARKKTVFVNFSNPKDMARQIEEGIEGLDERVQASLADALKDRPVFFVTSWEKTENYTPDNREYKKIFRIISGNNKYDNIDFEANYNEIIKLNRNNLGRLASYFDVLSENGMVLVLEPKEEKEFQVDDVQIQINGSSATFIITGVESALEAKRENDVNSFAATAGVLILLASVAALVTAKLKKEDQSTK